MGKISPNLQEGKMSQKATQWFFLVLPTVEQDDGHADSYRIPPAVISLKNTEISAHCLLHSSMEVDVGFCPPPHPGGYRPPPPAASPLLLFFYPQGSCMALVGQFLCVPIHEPHGDSHWECWKIHISLLAEEWPWCALPGTSSHQHKVCAPDTQTPIPLKYPAKKTSEAGSQSTWCRPTQNINKMVTCRKWLL